MPTWWVAAFRVGGVANIRRCRAEAATKCSIEVREIGKAGRARDVRDPAAAPDGIAQQRGGAFETLGQQMVREATAGLLEQKMHVARRDAEQRRHGARRQARIGVPMLDIAQDRRAAGRAAAALLGGVARVAFGAEQQRNEVMDMSNDPRPLAPSSSFTFA